MECTAVVNKFVYLEVSESVDLKTSHHIHTHTHAHTHACTILLYEVTDVFTNLIVLIILLHKHVPNHDVAHLRLTQCGM